MISVSRAEGTRDSLQCRGKLKEKELTPTKERNLNNETGKAMNLVACLPFDDVSL